MLSELSDLEEALDIASKVDVSALPGSVLADVVSDLHRMTSKLAALDAASVAAFDASGEWSVGGHKTCAVWLRHNLRCAGPEANARVRMARRLRRMPLTAEALGRGELTTAHVRVLATACDLEEFADAEALLVDHARELSFRDFERTVRYFRMVVDATSADDEARDQAQRRGLHASKLLDDMGRVDGWLDPVGFAIFKRELDRLEQKLFEEDWAIARAEHGPDASQSQLPRTGSQRRANALVEMAKRSATAPADGKEPAPLVFVHMDAETFEAALREAGGLEGDYPTDRLCELEDGTPITPIQAIELALWGHIRRIVYESPDVLLNVGRKQRLYRCPARCDLRQRPNLHPPRLRDARLPMRNRPHHRMDQRRQHIPHQRSHPVQLPPPLLPKRRPTAVADTVELDVAHAVDDERDGQDDRRRRQEPCRAHPQAVPLAGPHDRAEPDAHNQRDRKCTEHGGRSFVGSCRKNGQGELGREEDGKRHRYERHPGAVEGGLRGRRANEQMEGGDEADDYPGGDAECLVGDVEPVEQWIDDGDADDGEREHDRSAGGKPRLYGPSTCLWHSQPDTSDVDRAQEQHQQSDKGHPCASSASARILCATNSAEIGCCWSSISVLS